MSSLLSVAVLFLWIVPANLQAEDSSSLEGYLNQARIYEGEDNYRAAEDVYKKALALAPNDAETLKRLGVLYQTELKFPASIELFRRVLTMHSQYPEVNFFLGVSYYGMNDFPAAVQSFRKELETPRPHPRCRYYLALALQEEGHLEDSLVQLNRLVAQNPRDEDALYQLARIHKNASLRAIQMLHDIDPDSFQLRALMGEIYSDEERYAEAISEYRAALAKRPGATGLHYAIGIAYWAQNQLEPAEKEFQLARQEDPHNPLTNLYLGDIAVRQRRFDEALPYLQTAEAGQPGMAKVHLLLGRCYQELNDLEKAKQEMIKASEKDPSDPQPHYLLAQIYRKMNDPEAGARELAVFEKLSKEAKARTFKEAQRSPPKQKDTAQ